MMYMDLLELILWGILYALVITFAAVVANMVYDGMRKDK